MGNIEDTAMVTEAYQRGYKDGYMEAFKMFKDQFDLLMLMQPIQIQSDKVVEPKKGEKK